MRNKNPDEATWNELSRCQRREIINLWPELSLAELPKLIWSRGSYGWHWQRCVFGNRDCGLFEHGEDFRGGYEKIFEDEEDLLKYWMSPVK